MVIEYILFHVNIYYAVFLNLCTTGFSGEMILCDGISPVHCRMLSSMSGTYLILVASSLPSHLCLHSLTNALWENRMVPVGNYCYNAQFHHNRQGKDYKMKFSSLALCWKTHFNPKVNCIVFLTSVLSSDKI